jgi:hypothetical protein
MDVAVLIRETQETMQKTLCNLEETRAAQCPWDTTDSTVSPDKTSGFSLAMLSRISKTSGNFDMTLLHSCVRKNDTQRCHKGQSMTKVFHSSRNRRAS